MCRCGKDPSKYPHTLFRPFEDQNQVLPRESIPLQRFGMFSKIWKEGRKKEKYKLSIHLYDNPQKISRLDGAGFDDSEDLKKKKQKIRGDRG